MKSLNTTEINLHQIEEALRRMMETAVNYKMTNEKSQAAIYQYLVHLEAQDIIRDFIDPVVQDLIPSGKHLRVELRPSKSRWKWINVYISDTNQNVTHYTPMMPPLPPFRINLLP